MSSFDTTVTANHFQDYVCNMQDAQQETYFRHLIIACNVFRNSIVIEPNTMDGKQIIFLFYFRFQVAFWNKENRKLSSSCTFWFSLGS